MIYAEVIGDPIAQSKSPIIHKHWLNQLGIEGDYLKTRVPSDELSSFLKARWSESNWRGCNVTIPHKVKIIPLLSGLETTAIRVRAVNCVERKVTHLADRLIGHNTDLDGVAAALDSTELRGRKAAIIGAGGAARAMLTYLGHRGAKRIDIVARNRQRAEALRAVLGGVNFRIVDFDRTDAAFGGAAAIINASPLGMEGADPMPQSLLNAVAHHAAGATVFDMVTTPAETHFLAAGRRGGGRPVDGLTMLIGQAARAFELFFGAPAPAPDAALRALLATHRRDSA